MLTGAQLAVQALEGEGVELAFGLPGVHNLALWRAVGESGIRLIGVRHAFFADHFLQAHDVGRDLRDDVGDPVQVATAVESDTAMDVVAHDGEVHHTASG